jgi:hypothetical protein
MAQNGCETPARNFPDPERVALIREAFRLELFSVAWMMVEAVVAIGAGIAAHSISLIAFGIDSLIELASAGVLICAFRSSSSTGAPSRSPPSGPQAGSPAVFCSHSPPMSRSPPVGVYGIARARGSLGPA